MLVLMIDGWRLDGCFGFWGGSTFLYLSVLCDAAFFLCVMLFGLDAGDVIVDVVPGEVTLAWIHCWLAVIVPSTLNAHACHCVRASEVFLPRIRFNHRYTLLDRSRHGSQS